MSLAKPREKPRKRRTLKKKAAEARKPGKLPKSQTQYAVEKFLPAECPKCKHKFEKQNRDWVVLLGDIVKGRKVVRETKGYDIIICAYCGNWTARYPLESYRVSSLRSAQKFLKRGFVNLQEVEIYVRGKARDTHTVSAKIPGIEVEGVTAD